MENTSTDKRVWIFVILPLILALLNLGFLWLQCFNPTDTSNPESMVVYFAERVASGQSMFLDYHKSPYILIPYTPFHYWLLGKAAGIFALTREQIFVDGRIFTLCCTLLIGLLLYQRTRSEEKFPASVMGALLFLSSYVLWPMAATNRPDILGVLISLAGFLVFTQEKSSNLRWLGVPLFVLAFFTKQNFVAAPAAIFFWLVFQKKWKESFYFGTSYAFLLLAIFFLIHHGSGGLSTMNWVDPNADAPYSFYNLRLVTLLFLQVSPLPVILAIAGAADKGIRRPETIYFILSLALGIVSSSRLGSFLNYYIEPLAAGCLLVPSGFRAAIQVYRGSKLGFLIAAFFVLLIPSINFISHSLGTLNFPRETEVRQRLSKVDRPIITDVPRFALISHEPFFIEPFTLSYMEKGGKWSSKGIVDMLQKQQIGLIVLSLPAENSQSWQGFKRLPLPVLAAIQKYYRLDGVLDGYRVYVPKDKS